MNEFFPGGVVPSGLIERSRFLNKAYASDEAGFAQLAKEIDALNPSDILKFLDGVLSHTSDQRIYALVYQSPAVVGKMGLDCIVEHFKWIYGMSSRDLLTREFFEACATSLVTGYANKRHLNLLAKLHSVVSEIEPDMNYVERFQSQAFDQAMAKHLAGVLPHDQDFSKILDSADGLRKVELPATLEVLLHDRMSVGAQKVAIDVVADLFRQDKLSASYVAVCRKVLGDGLFLDTCQQCMTSDRGIRSVAKLAAVFGEGTFHTPKFFKTLEFGLASGEIPKYLEKFNQMKLDETKLPLLAGFMVENLDIILKFEPAERESLAFTLDVLALANRVGSGTQAFRLMVNNLRRFAGLDGSWGTPAQIINGVVHQKLDPYGTIDSVRAYDHLIQAVNVVGLQTLKEVSPDVGSAFIMQFLEKHPTDLSQTEVMRMFPQAKGRYLENDLGL